MYLFTCVRRRKKRPTTTTTTTCEHSLSCAVLHIELAVCTAVRGP